MKTWLALSTKIDDSSSLVSSFESVVSCLSNMDGPGRGLDNTAVGPNEIVFNTLDTVNALVFVFVAHRRSNVASDEEEKFIFCYSFCE